MTMIALSFEKKAHHLIWYSVCLELISALSLVKKWFIVKEDTICNAVFLEEVSKTIICDNKYCYYYLQFIAIKF